MIRMTLSIVALYLLMFSGSACRTQKYKGDTMDRNNHPQDSISWIRPRFKEREKERHCMVREDIMKDPFHPVRDKKVLKAMECVPRHLFVPEEYRMEAYDDQPLPIGYGQTISQPLIVASMTEMLDIHPGDKILEIGTGSGYQAAVLSELTPHVYTVEIVKDLGRHAKKLLSELGYKTVKVKIGDGYEGWPGYAPYDGIIVTCAPEKIPQPLIDQLKPGGKIVIPVGREGMTQWLYVVTKTSEGKIKKKTRFPVIFVPMTGKAEEEEK